MPAVRVGHHDEWPTLGWEVIDWVEAYLCHGPGDVEGESLELDDEWVQFLLDCYRLYPKNHDRAGQRVVTRGVLSRPKGRAKSELAGAIVCAEARGPVRFDGWGADKEPVGRPVRSPFIRCLATEESQAGNTYDNVTVMLDHAGEHHPELFAGIDIGKSAQGSTRIYLPGGGEIRPSTASSAAKDGGKETFAVADETHLYVLPSLRSMHRMVSRNLRKRKRAEPWMLDTTTAHQPGQQSVAEGTYDRSQALLEGRRARAGGFYFNHREGLEVSDWADDGQVLTSLREGYYKAVDWVDLDRILTDDIRSPEATEEDSRRYWLNQVRAGNAAAFDLDRWRQLAKPKFKAPEGSLIVVGVDGARFQDSLGIIATDISSGHQWPVGIWERPEDAPPDYEHPAAAIDGAMVELFSLYEVWRAYCDPQWIENLVDRWTGRWGEKRIVEWYTNRPRQIAFAVRAYRSAQTGGDLSHDGDAVLSRHIGNARKMPLAVKDDDGRPMWSIQKERPGSPLKIDGAMAGVLSWECRGDAIADDAQPPKRNRVVAF